MKVNPGQICFEVMSDEETGSVIPVKYVVTDASDIQVHIITMNGDKGKTLGVAQFWRNYSLTDIEALIKFRRKCQDEVAMLELRCGRLRQLSSRAIFLIQETKIGTDGHAGTAGHTVKES